MVFGLSVHGDDAAAGRARHARVPLSGPLTATDAAAVAACDAPSPRCVEIGESRDADVAGVRVRRALPRRGRRTVGNWCFADHLGPADVTDRSGLAVGAHPHLGLQTVTWLIEGQLLHRDSLGSEQVISPGQLNLMTAGHGVSHSEESTGHRGTLEGIQLWVAQPDATRDGAAGFEHHAGLPRVEIDRAVATVLVGRLGGATSPARRDSALVGADLALSAGVSTIPLDPAWEHAVIVLRGAVDLHGRRVSPGQLAYLGTGRDSVDVEAAGATRALLLGGEPMADKIVMWWNFVGRTPQEVTAAYKSWQAQDDRFGTVASALPRIPAPAPPWRA